jgi:hypothetical protein
VPQDDYKAQTLAQMVDRVSQATQYINSETIAGHPNHKEVVRPFVEDQFDRHPCIGAADHYRERALPGRVIVAGQTEIPWINLYGASNDAALFSQTCEKTITSLQARTSVIGGFG